MRICIIGAGGVIGRALCDSGEKSNIEVVGIVRETPKPANKNIVQWIRNSDAIKQVIASHQKWDAVFDLRAFHPNDIIMIKEMASVYTSHWFHISSIYVYKNLKVAFIDKKDCEFKENERCNPSGEYGINKLACEKEWGAGAALQKSNYSLLRLPFIYGPNERNARWQVFVKAINERQKLSLPNRGRKRIDLLYSLDLAGILLSLIGNESVYGEIINIADINKYSLSDHINAIAGCLGKKVVLTAPEKKNTFAEYPYVYPADLSLNTDKLQKLALNYTFTDLSESWENTIRLACS